LSVTVDGPLIRPAPFKPTRDDGRRGNWLRDHRPQLVVAAVVGAVGWFIWFIFTAKSVQLSIDPADADVTIDGGFDLTLRGVYVLREGDYQLHIAATGYEPLDVPLRVAAERNQSYAFTLTPLPGRITFSSTPVAAEVWIDGANVGSTPLDNIDVAAGTHLVSFRNPRYVTIDRTVNVQGKRIEETISAELQPNWAAITIPSNPPGAVVFVDEQQVGETPGPIDVVAGSHELRLKKPGYKTWRNRIDVVAQQDQSLPSVTLEAADGLVNVTSSPGGASVTVDGVYHGETPLEVALTPGRTYQVSVTRAGYQTAKRAINVRSGEEQALRVDLAALLGKVLIHTEPADAEVFIDAKSIGSGNQALTLPVRPQQLEVRAPNHAPFKHTFTPQPGLTQEINATLLTLAEARKLAMPARRTAGNGQEMVLLSPGRFSMGASRREPGRRSNEVLHEVQLTRLFYLATTEVTNAQFKAFAAGHDSGVYEDHKLNEDEQPVVRVTWTEAALYCNWLSQRDHLPPFYKTDAGKITGFDRTATGYRMPTEAEWEWVARTVPNSDAERRFPWGDDFPPPDRSGNYADRSAGTLVGRSVFGYNDNEIVAAAVKTYPADAHGLFDIGGNVAEWVNDFYEIPKPAPQTNPFGPSSGEYHVIKGASWMSGTITELRASFRNYGTDGREDLGFRIARNAE
jgi:formylglycine-generating enzyme required for sulfatase activity